VVSGLRLYQDSCAACHGVSGYGDGPSGKGLKPKAADLTSKHTGDHTAGDLFWWLNHGKTETAMPGFRQSLTEEEVWDLINFARTLSAAEQARSMSPLAEPNPWLVAPDFVYRTAKIEGEALKDHRGRNIVLLVLFTLPQSQIRLEQLDQAYEKLRSLGVEILAVPREQERMVRELRPSVRLLPVVTDGSQEIFQTYALFRRSFSADGTLPDPPIPTHMEFLIDRQGYVRARWIQGEDVGWAKIENLLQEIDRLNREKPSRPAPDDHVH
jgi:putative copper resistance protein D